MVPKMSGIEVKNIREKLGITQVELAEKLGVTQAALSQWESGKRKPSGPVVVLLRQIEGSEQKKSRRRS